MWQGRFFMSDVSEKSRALAGNEQEPAIPSQYMSGQALADLSEKTAITLCVFPQNARQPGVDSSLARMFFEQLPTVAAMDGAQVSDRATVLPWDARDMSRALSHDIEQGREIIDWLAPHLPKHIVTMFDKGSGSTLNPVFEKLAREGGFERDDVLSREAVLQKSENIEKNKRQSLFAQASQFLGLGR